MDLEALWSNQSCGLLDTTVTHMAAFRTVEIAAVKRQLLKLSGGKSLEVVAGGLAQIGQLGFLVKPIRRHSANLASKNKTVPTKASPVPVRHLIAPSACMEPMTPTKGEITPLSAQFN